MKAVLKAIGMLAGFGVLLGAIGATAAEMPGHSMDSMQHASDGGGQFQQIEQPLGNRVAVTIGGLGLIGLELWWFLLSKPKSQKAAAADGIQEVTVTVDGGYEPSRIVVRAGQPVRLKFNRQDPSSCLEEVRLPDFHIAQALPLHQTTAIEFTPTEPGTHTFTCGMNMFRGEIEVETAMPEQTKAAIPA
ncbi:cupredoxin domain-containing protein [Phormidium tenue FACHB-886]|nr:cupredoxin domain-containing protein [Phormidium tenue FACHB-886]